MYLFNYPPYQTYVHLPNPKRDKITVEALAADMPLAQSFKTVAESLGSDVSVEILYFPTDYQGDYALVDKPNSHLYQVLGSCVVEGHACTPGDMVRLSSPTILVQSSSSAPCVFARFVVNQPIQPGMENPFDQPTELSKMILVDDYLPGETCERIIGSLFGTAEDYGKVLTSAHDNKTEQNFQYRKTNIMHSREDQFVRDVLNEVITKKVEPFFDTTIEFWNTPVLLKYDAGGFFVPHTDGEILDATTNTWSRIYDRDYTLVCFLNENYEGGELSFPDQNLVVKPKQGRVVAFPADHRFRHGAEKTISGTRYQLVSWLTAYGSIRTNTPPNPTVIYRTW